MEHFHPFLFCVFECGNLVVFQLGLCKTIVSVKGKNNIKVERKVVGKNEQNDLCTKIHRRVAVSHLVVKFIMCVVCSASSGKCGS